MGSESDLLHILKPYFAMYRVRLSDSKLPVWLSLPAIH
jgi:hypothetical protein